MKTLKSLFMLCAGLSFCACSSDNDEVQLPEGAGMIEVNVVNPSTRLTTGTEVSITGNITVTLYYNNTSMSQIVSAGSASSVRFWNITNPERVTASINGGVSSYAEIEITQTDANADGGNLQAAPENIPAYGETPVSSFQLTGVMNPTEDEKSALQNGLTEDTKNKTFQKWSATVKMAIPVARLEVGAISHVSHTGQDGDDCLFRPGELLIKGVYLDNTSLKGAEYSFSTTKEDIKYPAVVTDAEDNRDGINDAYLNNVQNDAAATFSEETAFNFYASTINPIFKVYFSSANLAAGGENQGREGWAMIRSYKLGDEEITLENGKIYTITSVTLRDENVVGGEDNDAVYGVDVTVEEAVWAVVPITAEWEGDPMN